MVSTPSTPNVLDFRIMHLNGHYLCTCVHKYVQPSTHSESVRLAWFAKYLLLSVPIVLTGYLKLYQLQQPNLSQYHVILVDEAQDLSPGSHS